MSWRTQVATTQKSCNIAANRGGTSWGAGFLIYSWGKGKAARNGLPRSGQVPKPFRRVLQSSQVGRVKFPEAAPETVHVTRPELKDEPGGRIGQPVRGGRLDGYGAGEAKGRRVSCERDDQHGRQRESRCVLPDHPRWTPPLLAPSPVGKVAQKSSPYFMPHPCPPGPGPRREPPHTPAVPRP